ncbi:class I SAM-dependent methyltransferase [bacterium]|nr:class I SAM-dependent methyltransferase [bacterium]
MKKDPRSITLVDQRRFIGEIAEAYTGERFAAASSIQEDLAAILAKVSDDPLLELGAGGGVVLELLRKAGRSAWGVEVVDEMILQARRRGVKGMIQADGCDLPFPDARFALITLWGNTLGPIPGRDNRLRLLRESSRVLRPDGWLAVTALNRFAGPRRMLKQQEFSFRFQLQSGRWSSLSGYNRYYTRGQLKRELREGGFSRFRIQSGFTDYMHILLAGK